MSKVVISGEMNSVRQVDRVGKKPLYFAIGLSMLQIMSMYCFNKIKTQAKNETKCRTRTDSVPNKSFRWGI